MSQETVEKSQQIEENETEKMAGSENAQTHGVKTAEKKEAQDPDFEKLIETETKANGKENRLDLLLDLDMSINVELGKTSMMIKDILELGRGSIIEFDKLVSEPVDVLINGRKMAEGEVVVVDKHFGIRITSMADPSDRLKGLKK